jgi:hypothetical protein
VANANNKFPGKKIQAHFDQRLHIDLIRESAGRPDHLLTVLFREKIFNKKLNYEVVKIERQILSEADFSLEG